MMIFNKAAAIVWMGLSVFSVCAQEGGQSAVYIGYGPANNSGSSTTSNKSPIAIGYLNFSDPTGFVYGVDISGEGTMLDSTWGKSGVVKQAVSINVLLGKRLIQNVGSRWDAAFIVGVRQKTQSCPASYVGYQCYADALPQVNYHFNYGGALTWATQNFLMGIRVTGESKQALVGFRF